jgi:hypothetical protein
MTKYSAAAVLLLSAACLTGCGKDRYALPENPVVFETGHFVNPDDPEDDFCSVEWDGRTYILFGIEKKRTHFGKCLGYVKDDENRRIFTAEGLPETDYLIEYYTAGVMEQAVYLRCVDTRGEPVPEQLESYGYPFWESESADDTTA